MTYNRGWLSQEMDVTEISNIRCAVDNALGETRGVQWILSSISGEKKRREDGIDYCIAVLVAFTPSDVTRCDFVFRTLHDAGLTVRSKSEREKDPEKLFPQLCTLFKDHNNRHIASIIEQSNRKQLQNVVDQQGMSLVQDDEDAISQLDRRSGFSRNSIRYVFFEEHKWCFYQSETNFLIRMG